MCVLPHTHSMRKDFWNLRTMCVSTWGTISGVLLAKTERISYILHFLKNVLIYILQWSKVIQCCQFKLRKPKSQISSKLWQKIGYGKTSLHISHHILFHSYSLSIAFLKSDIFGVSLPFWLIFGQILPRSSSSSSSSLAASRSRSDQSLPSDSSEPNSPKSDSSSDMSSLEKSSSLSSSLPDPEPKIIDKF